MGYVIAMGSQLGLMIALPLIVCVLIGIMIDRKLSTFPFGLLASVFAGIVLTVVDVYKIVIPFLEKRSEENNKK